MRGLSSTTFKQWFGSDSLLVNLNFIWQLSILSYYARGILLQAIEGFLPPAHMIFSIMNLKPLRLFQTCGPVTWGEWSPWNISLQYISDMYSHALFEFRHLCRHLTYRPSVLCQWTWFPVDFLQLDTTLNSKTSLKNCFQTRTFPSMSATLWPLSFIAEIGTRFLLWSGTWKRSLNESSYPHSI